ncbi:TonB-dependent receptor domain-containing protein [Shimia sp. MMG029]|uniref:TonB-dependent receptor domain-containing protein n=1 Tax=Shimia sp. MMG029 TaxID=3021978 RepID=UPI0022FEA339|nr:TonB-dependent receptor [Shimia sp. MMG029]MDA5559076.1 TonB-dependent receptor [Shimia sp. MMG029]
MHSKNKNGLLLSAASTLALVVASTPVIAQNLDASADEGEYLGEITLGTSKREVQVDTAVPVTEINQEEIDDRQASTVAELVDSVPGVTLVNGSTPQSSGISIRGFGANATYGTNPRVLVLVDGATTGGEEIYRIGNQLFTDPALYKSVSVLRGTVGSFEYGSGVVGGVVRLETKDASDFTGGEIGTRFRQTLQGQSNGAGWAASSILAMQPTEDTEFLFSLTYRDQDTYDDGNGTETAGTDFSDYSYLLKGRHTFGNNKEHAISAWYNATQSNDKDVPYDILGASTGGGFYFGNVDRKVDSRVVGVRYQYDQAGNDLIHFDANLTYAEQDIDSTYVPGSCSGFPGCDFAVGSLLNADHNYKTTKLNLKNTSYFNTGNASHDLRYGIEFVNREREDANSAPGGTDRRIAVFAVDDIRIGDRFTLSPAVRYEHQDVEGTDVVGAGATDPYDDQFSNSALMGGVSARYEFDSGFGVFASAAYSEGFPIIDNLDKPSFVWVPEKSTTYEAGFSFNRADLFSSGDNFALKVNYYDTNVRDVRATGNVLAVVDVEGIEIEASYGHSSGFYVDLNGTAASGDQSFPDGSVSDWRFAPVSSAALTVGKRFDEVLDLSWELVAACGTEAINNTGPIAGYGVNNIRATYRPQNGALEGVEVRFGIENVLDKQYQTQLSTRASAGRNFKLSLAKTF